MGHPNIGTFPLIPLFTMKSIPLSVFGPELKLIDGDATVFWLPAVHQLSLILSHFRFFEIAPFSSISNL